MQYVLKLTPLGIEHHVFRVVSVDGMADTEHVLNLCNLSFGYANYDSKELLFAKDAAAFKALSVDLVEEDDDHYGPTGNEFLKFWTQEPKLDGQDILHMPLKSGSTDALKRFDILLDSMCQMLKDSSANTSYDGAVEVDAQKAADESATANTVMADTHPSDQNLRFKFLYSLNGVKHLVEVMMSSEKLNCFLPATLMGDGLIVDDKEDKPLSIAMLNELMAEHENDEALEDGLNLRDCTSRMRALGAMRGADKINKALVDAGAEPLAFKLD